ncbi:MAG: N-6 DNA methylase, partial [Candidatus Nitrosopelagicus sp.]|nr:N-6 DNA methylase [Candidatus Nitrosopelagicus sp.]
DFKKTETGKTILPFIVLRRLGRVLEPTKDKVLSEYEKIKNEKPEYVEARLNKITGHGFHNHSKYNLELLLADPKSLQKNIQSYIRGFSENVRDIFEKFGFETTLNKLDEHEILFNMVEKFASSELDFDPEKIDNHMMGMIYEEVIRRANEATNEEAGHHFTPREVITLMVNLLFSHEKDSLSKKGIIKTIYDPASGTGGMLSVASDYIAKINPDAIIDTYGQEKYPETYAICKSDMLIKGLELDRIKLGNSLIAGKKGDGFYDEKFHYMLSNPPFGVDWGKYERGIRDEEEKGEQGKYGAGTPRKSDGSLLFLLSMISKMKPKEEGGSRIAIVLNGSPLFTGEAGSGESDIRKWIIENDMLEAIVAMPNDMFYNTGINTYIWIISNNKDEKRKGKIQLINAVGTEFFQKMKSSLGKKRNEISDEQIKSITKIYDSFKEGEFSKIFDNNDFGYYRITVDRPLKRNFKVSADRLEKLQQEKAFLKLDELKSKPKQPKCKDVLKVLSTMPSKTYKDHDTFSTELKNAFSKGDYKITSSQLKTIENSLSERDEEATPQRDSKGNLVADSDLRDNENIPLKGDIDKYFAKEVTPYVPDAWIDESNKDNVGYDIQFTKQFYVYNSLRSLEEIDKDLKENQKEISKIQNEVVGE